jgi:hypothetical protein
VSGPKREALLKLSDTAVGFADQPADKAGFPVIFIIDDDIAIREALRELLENDGHPVKAANAESRRRDAGHHLHRTQQRAYGRQGHEGGCLRLHREADRLQ